MTAHNFFKIQYKYHKTPSVWHDVECVTANVDEKTVDMKCASKQDDIITHFRVLGRSAMELCSLYISAGKMLLLLFYLLNYFSV